MGQGVVVDAEFVKWFATLGVGGVLAAMMFLYYRKDVRLYTEMWKGQSEMLMSTLKDNSAAITKLTSVIEALHRRLDHEEGRR